MIANIDSIIHDISSHADLFFKSTYLYPRVAFSQYVLRQFLTLYFVNTQDLVACDAYFKILYLKQIMNALRMTSHYFALIAIQEHKSSVEKQYQDLLFQAKHEAVIPSLLKQDLSWLDESIAYVNREIDRTRADIAQQLKQAPQIVDKKIEQLFERFQEIESVAMYSFQKAHLASQHGKQDVNLFKKQIHYHLQQHLKWQDMPFFQQYGLTLLGCSCLFAAMAILCMPNIMLSLGVNGLLVAMALGLTGGVAILLNRYIPYSEKDYTQLSQNKAI